MVKLLFVLFLAGLIIPYTVAAKLDVDDMEEEKISDQKRTDVVKRRSHYVIKPNRAGPWGHWGISQFCPDGSFASGFKIKVERPDGDDTAMNGIKLYCGKPNGQAVGVHITSSVGPWGDWDPHVRSCHSGQFLLGFILRVESRQGRGDDTAANDIRMRCEGSWTFLYGGGTSWGRWSEYVRCRSGYAICGLQTKVEERQGSGDDTALNNVRFYCCRRS